VGLSALRVVRANGEISA